MSIDIVDVIGAPRRDSSGIVYTRDARTPFDHRFFIREEISRNAGGLIVNQRTAFKDPSKDLGSFPVVGLPSNTA